MAAFNVTPQNQADIAGLYAAFWNRAPDTTGFGFWVNKLASGEMTLDEISIAFRNAPEGKQAYPEWSTNGALVNEVYNNVFGRAPDAEGYAFWLGKLDGGLPFPELVVAMCQAAVANGSADGALFINKVDVGIYVATVAKVDGGYVCDQAFNLVTADPASVQTAESWVDANNTGATYTLTTNIDSINVDGHKVNTVTGLQEATASQTWNTGDTINGNGQTRLNLVINSDDPSIVDVNDVASVNINLISNSVLDTVEFTDVNQILVTSGVSLSEGAGNLTVLNANQATVHGFASTGRVFNQNIFYADTTGTADVAALMMAGTGTSTQRSAFNFDHSNDMEIVTLATSGSNYVTLNAGTNASKFTITGSGMNNILFGTAAATKLIDASATTGINTLNLDTQLSSGDSIIGGAAADTLVADLISGAQLLPTVSGVETLNLDFSAAAILNASKITGATHLNIAGSSANASVTNLANSTNTLGTSVSNAGSVSVSYLKGAATNVTYNLGGDAAVSNAATTFANIGSLTMNASGESTSATGDLTLGAAATSLVVNAAAAANDMTIGAVSGSGLQTISINANGGDVVLGDVNGTTDGSELQALTIVATDGADVTVGTIDANSADASAFSSLSVLTGDDSTISLGSIIGLSGKNTVSTYSVTLGDNIGNSSIGSVTAESIGDVNVKVGTNASDSGRTLNLNTLTANSIGDINVIVGKNNWVAVSTSGIGVSNYSLGSLNASGEGSLEFFASAGSDVDAIGTVDLTELSGSSDVNLENITLGVVMIGGSGADEFKATHGADYIIGNDGNDTLWGEDADDDIDGGDGADSINGGTGNDVIQGGAGEDTLKGSFGDDAIYGDEGDDFIEAGSGNDTVWSGDDDDYVRGDRGIDLLYGETGSDTIFGGADDDTVSGGTGADIFSYVEGASPVATAAQVLAANGTDTITDFTTTENDGLYVAPLLQLNTGFYADKAFVSGTASGITRAANNVIVVTDVQTGAGGSMTLAEVDTLIASLSSMNGSGTLLVNNNGSVQLFYDSNLGTAGGASDVALIGIITTPGIAADLVNITTANFPMPVG